MVTREQIRSAEQGEKRSRFFGTLAGIGEAVASMMMDMRKHPDCGVPHEIHAIGIFAAEVGDVALARAYIDGFN